ncbi:hypothetical protein BH11PSE6_BH11PSE6_08960 [soil metagenome]
MQLVPALAALFLLGGCWSGPAWFSAAEAVAVIPDGNYRLVETGASPLQGDVLGITRQADGALAVSGADNPLRAVIVPLDPARPAGLYIVQLEQIAEHPRNALYMLLDNGGGRYRLTLLRCTSAAGDVAKESGGHVSRDPQSASSCIFADRATLVTALRAAADRPPAAELELIPVAQ